MSNSSRPHGLQSTRLLRPWDFPGKSTGVGCHFLLQRIFPTQGLNLGLPHCRQMLYRFSHQAKLFSNLCYSLYIKEQNKYKIKSQLGPLLRLLLLLSRFSRVQLFTTPWTTAHQAPPSMGFSRQEYWSGVPLPSLNLDH